MFETIGNVNADFFIILKELLFVFLGLDNGI